MLGNPLAAALRHLARNRFYSAISVIGLAIGIAAALSAALVIHSELHYDQFFPGYEQAYRVTVVETTPDRGVKHDAYTSPRLRQVLMLHPAEVAATARIIGTEEVRMRRGNVEALERVYWADPSLFEVLPLPSLSGNLRDALRKPDGIVLTRSIARKYFGRDDPVGEILTITLVPHPIIPSMQPLFGQPASGSYVMTVAAVIEDLPGGTQLGTGVFLSGLAAFSALTQLDKARIDADDSNFYFSAVATFARMAAGPSLRHLRDADADIVKRMYPRKGADSKLSLKYVRVDRMHTDPVFNPGLRPRLGMTGLIGALILFVACVNFVNLLTAQLAARAKEVAVRKATGASRASLAAQFIGESFVYVALAGVLAAALAEWTLPELNAYLDFRTPADWWRGLGVWTCAVGGAVALAVLVGAYPALVLSSLRPVKVFNGAHALPRSSDLVRRILVTLQFSVLIALLITAGVIWQQRRFATTEALRVETDQVLMIRSDCRDGLLAGLRALPGIRGVACLAGNLLGETNLSGLVYRADGRPPPHPIALMPLQRRALDLLGVRPIAGDWSHADAPVDDGAQDRNGVVLNDKAVHDLGFASAQAAVGQTVQGVVSFGEQLPTEQKRIAAVVRDFSLLPVDSPIPPTVYFPAPSTTYDLMAVKLAGAAIPETLVAIDRVWKTTGHTTPIDQFFLEDHIQTLYVRVLREAQAFGVFALVAGLLAGLGLIALSASVAERRTREIGIRKATGARTLDIVRLLVWRFTKPVVWANLIAWPIAGYGMNRWLHGFALHTDLQPWLFVAASVIALLFALLTVSAHSFRVARASPVLALRHE